MQGRSAGGKTSAGKIWHRHILSTRRERPCNPQTHSCLGARSYPGWCRPGWPGAAQRATGGAFSGAGSAMRVGPAPPLAPLLKEAGVLDEGREVVFFGTDAGEEVVREQTLRQHFARSM